MSRYPDESELSEEERAHRSNTHWLALLQLKYNRANGYGTDGDDYADRVEWKARR